MVPAICAIPSIRRTIAHMMRMFMLHRVLRSRRFGAVREGAKISRGSQHFDFNAASFFKSFLKIASE